MSRGDRKGSLKNPSPSWPPPGACRAPGFPHPWGQESDLGLPMPQHRPPRSPRTISCSLQARRDMGTDTGTDMGMDAPSPAFPPLQQNPGPCVGWFFLARRPHLPALAEDWRCFLIPISSSAVLEKRTRTRELDCALPKGSLSLSWGVLGCSGVVWVPPCSAHQLCPHETAASPLLAGFLLHGEGEKGWPRGSHPLNPAVTTPKSPPSHIPSLQTRGRKNPGGGKKGFGGAARPRKPATAAVK